MSVSSATHSISYARHFFELACASPLATTEVLGQLYPDGPKCASCGAPITGRRALESFKRGDRTHCAACNTKFSPRANTILADSHLTYGQFDVISALLSLGVDHQRIAAMADVSTDTVAAWHSKIKYWERHA